MLKKLIATYGKDKINSLTKYPSILTLHKIGEKGCLTDEFTTDITNEIMTATEKIDGTNVRIICYGNEYLIGSREFILHHSDDLYYDPSQGIVEGLKALNVYIPNTKYLTVIYGEFYGGKTSNGAKNYGKDKNGFRVFDIAIYNDFSILEKSLPEISLWRERETENGIIYGQQFYLTDYAKYLYPQYDYVPQIEFDLGDMSHASILEKMYSNLQSTNVALSDDALKKPEGMVLRNKDRTKIVKIRFEDYERTLKNKKK